MRKNKGAKRLLHIPPKPAKPPKPQKAQRKRKLVAFQPPRDVLVFLGEMKEIGYGPTETCVSALRLLRDLERELGPEYRTLESLGNEQGLSIGSVLGRLTARALKETAKK